MLQLNDFKHICRTCLSHSNELVSLFKPIENDSSFGLMLTQCFSLEIYENDGLPKLICQNCVELIQQSYRFRKLCEQSDNKLRLSLTSKQCSATKDNIEIEMHCIVIENDMNMDKEFITAHSITTIDNPNNVNNHETECIQDVSASNFDSINKQNFCSECNQSFNTPTRLKHHMKIHSDIKLSCNICNKSFSRAFDVKRHMTKHNGSKPYVCKICSKSFTQSGTLSQHMKTHPEIPEAELKSSDKKTAFVHDKSHLCSICGKWFRDASSLTIHIRRHTGHKPYQCSECPLRFVASGRLTSHMRVHTGERPFSCPVCSKSFAHSTVMGLHMKTHTDQRPHQCTVCDKAFRTLYCLNIHKRRHSGERPHRCVSCDKSFADPRVLKQHTKVHTQDKPHVCNFCQRGFRRKHHLVKHMKTHDSNEAETV